jgi:hypothetical protein
MMQEDRDLAIAAAIIYAADSVRHAVRCGHSEYRGEPMSYANAVEEAAEIFKKARQHSPRDDT